MPDKTLFLRRGRDTEERSRKNGRGNFSGSDALVREVSSSFRSRHLPKYRLHFVKGHCASKILFLVHHCVHEGSPEKDLLKTGSNLFTLEAHLLWRPMFQIQLLISKIQPRRFINIP
jgi:hypothetical protein